jgi:hypothetical protein
MEKLPIDLGRIILLLIPILLLQLGLQIFALVDLIRRPKTQLPKWAWALIILLLEIFGPIIYFLFGRKEA